MFIKQNGLKENFRTNIPKISTFFEIVNKLDKILEKLSGFLEKLSNFFTR